MFTRQCLLRKHSSTKGERTELENSSLEVTVETLRIDETTSAELRQRVKDRIFVLGLLGFWRLAVKVLLCFYYILKRTTCSFVRWIMSFTKCGHIFLI